MKKIFSYMSSAATILLICLSIQSCNQAKKPVLSIYNWGDYIDESVIQLFEKEYNVKVRYNLFSSNEEMYVKLKQGSDSFDLVCPSDYMIERMINENMLLELDRESLPNLQSIDPAFLDLAFDRGNKYSLPYMWGTLGILYNTDVIKEPVDSWSILWNSKYEKRIGMYNSVRDSLVPPLKMAGYSLNTRNMTQLEEARNKLIEQKNLVLVYGEDNLKEMVTGNEIDMALVYSGDYGWVVEDFPNMAYAVPQEGSNIWFDNWVILKESKYKDLAHEFLNFICRDDIALLNAEYIGYASPIPSVVKQLDAETRNDPAIYPSKDVIANCEVFTDMGEFNQALDRLWTEVKASR